MFCHEITKERDCYNLSVLAYFTPNLQVFWWSLNFNVYCTIMGYFVMGWRCQELKIGVVVYRMLGKLLASSSFENLLRQQSCLSRLLLAWVKIANLRKTLSFVIPIHKLLYITLICQNFTPNSHIEELESNLKPLC